jgi:cell division protease FtsH
MANDNKQKPEQKKGLPGGFLLFLFAAVLVILTIQSMMDNKTSKVAFSHQAEHLVNLDLIQPEESRKIALGDNLVTFTGKFRDRETEEGKDRFAYLELVNKNQELTSEKARDLKNLDDTQKKVSDSADFFLLISGLAIPKNGYTVVGSVFDTPYRQNSVVVKSVSSKDLLSLKTVRDSLSDATKNPNENSVSNLGKDVLTLVQLFKSPSLGIGNEAMKQKLKDLEALVTSAKSSIPERLAAYRAALDGLNGLVTELNTDQNGVRLQALRSVRSYMEEIDQFNVVSSDLEKNVQQLDKSRQKVADVIWFFNNQEVSTRALEKQDPEAFGHWFAQAKAEWDGFALSKGLAFKAPDQPRNTVLEKKFKSQEPSPNYLSYLFTILPVLLVIFLLYFIFSRQMKGVGSTAMNFGKSPARLLTKEQNKITFKEVAGADEAKEELKEIVDFLKDPTKFTALGARIPKGVLLVGPPGTGKTLIAKAVAGEANRPFFSISGSDFVEMFVGVGASRIRDMFDTAKKNAPCIIFMDEIDAVGRHRGAGIGGGHDEREQTLNQLLVEMDGFDTREGVILMAATNRPDILDKALLRPGRFDRRVVLDLPDVKGRFEILKVHARKIKIDSSVDLMEIAKMTPGASGADLENILNEAALLAARRGRSAVTSSEAKESCDKVRYGKERRSLEMDENEKKTTAFHESGHAIVGLVVKHGDPVDKVTIIPRGMSLGATHFMPKKNRLGYWRKEALDLLAVLMGGRAAEEIFVDDMSSGAQQDIAQATRLARSMICEWGMSPDLGLVSYDERSESGQYLGMAGYHEKTYSEETAKKIDKEILKLVEDAHTRARTILEENRAKVQLMAEMLMEFESLDAQDVKEIVDNTWDVTKKRARLKVQDDLQRKLPPPAPTIDSIKKDPTPEPGLS